MDIPRSSNIPCNHCSLPKIQPLFGIPWISSCEGNKGILNRPRPGKAAGIPAGFNHTNQGELTQSRPFPGFLVAGKPLQRAADPRDGRKVGNPGQHRARSGDSSKEFPRLGRVLLPWGFFLFFGEAESAGGGSSLRIPRGHSGRNP